MNKKYWIVLLAFVIVIFYGLTLKAVWGRPSDSEIINDLSSPAKAFESSQERAKYVLASNIVDHKAISIDNRASVGLPDISYKNGHYFVALPGTPVLLAPAYYLGNLVGHPVVTTYAFVALITILTAIIIFLICKRLGFSNPSAFIAAIIYAICTNAWSYSISLYAHPFSALCLALGIWLTLVAKNEGRRWLYAIVWLVYALSISIDYPNLFILFPIIIWTLSENFYFAKKTMPDKNRLTVFRARPSYLLTILPFLGLVLLLGLYNKFAFGNWFEMGNNLRVTSLVGDKPVYYYYSMKQVMNIKYVENGLNTLLFSLGRGIFVFSPIVILSFFGIENLFRKYGKLALTICLVVLVDLLLYSFFYDPWGGWAFGPRYLIPVWPALAIMIGAAYEKYKMRSLFLFIFFALLYASFIVAGLGALTTNLIPPSSEAGRQIGFFYNLKFLTNGETASLFFAYIKNLFPQLTLVTFSKLLALGFLLFTSPILVAQLIKNISFQFKKVPKLLPEEALVKEGKTT